MAQNIKFEIDDTVRLKRRASYGMTDIIPEGREDNKTAKIVSFLDEGGCRLDRDLRGILYWNTEDLMLVEEES